MRTKRKLSFLTQIPSWVLALLTSIGSTFIALCYILVYGFMTFSGNDDEIIGSTIIPFVIYFSIIIIMIFLIVKRNPRSVWYVPVICNVILILFVIGESDLWRDSSILITICAGWVLSIIAAIQGVIVGKR